METQFAVEHAPRLAIGLVVVFALVMFFVALIVTALLVWAYCRIFSKAGYCWALGLLMLVPIANIIMPFILAFSEWPLSRELRQLKQQNAEA